VPGDVEPRAVTVAPPSPRIRVAQCLAFVALLAALIGALGPAERLRTTYAWPPETLPETKPGRAWYAPLLLVRYSPDAISANVPCTLAPALSKSDGPVTVLATARYPERVRGLAIRSSGDRLEVTVGDRVLSRVGLSRDMLDGGACAYRLRMADEQWTLERQGEVVGAGALDLLPVVTGLFSNLDLRSEGAPSLEVTTAVHATRTTTRQALAWTIAAIAIVAALFLVSVGGRPRRPWVVARTLAGGARANARAPDAFVAVVLAVWWVISPAYIDDGWVAARERMFESSRGFAHYYSALGVNQPLDYWVEWLHHWLAQATPSLLLNRLPAVLCLAVIWVLCRWIAARVLQPTQGTDRVPLWTLAGVFVIGAVAWDVTLRPEPVTALFVTGVAACMVLFLERESTAAVAVAAAFVALSVSAHHAGVVALAPVVVAAPRLLRWVRTNMAAATAIVAASLALLTLLLFVGADLEQRRLDSQVLRSVSHSPSWPDEVLRYTLLGEHHYGTPLRRASVALIALAALALVLRRRRGPFTALEFPAAALTAGLLLLVATPSKWPSHFGTLVGLAAVAFCCEAARLRREAADSDAWRLWPFVAVAGASGAVAWAWLERESWNVVDLRTLDWTPGFESWLPAGRLAAVLPLLCLGAALLVGRARRHDRLHAVPWRVAAWIGPLVAFPVLAFTSGVIVADTAKTSSWTLARQHLETLTGRDVRCGLGDDLLVPVLESARGVNVAAVAGPSPLPDWVPTVPVAGLQRYALGPTSQETASTPWFELPADRRIGIFVTGAPDLSSRLRLEWGRRAASGISQLGGGQFDATIGPFSGDSAWRFFTAGDLPTPEPRADVARVTLASDVPVALAVTAPVSYRNGSLASRMSGPGSRTLALPAVLVYLPCARLPIFANGIVEPPTHVVSPVNQQGPFRYPDTSPFLGVTDLYDLGRLSITDSENPPAEVVAYEVERHIPGAVLAPPTASTYAS
jgi:hypothetical protein